MSNKTPLVNFSNKYRDEYYRKLVSADEAVKVVESGDRVQYGEFANQAIDCDAALARRKDELKNVIINAVCFTWYPEVLKADPNREHFIVNDYYYSPLSRVLGDQALCYHNPPMYHQMAKALKNGTIPRHKVATVLVAPMDEDGNFNLGPSSSIVCLAREYCDYIIVEVNTSMPKCLGGPKSVMHISDVDFIVESSTNPPLYTTPIDDTFTETDVKIAKLIMSELEDGCCLQIGVGSLASVITKLIADSDLKDLGVHSELLPNSIVDLCEAGIITGNRKNIDKGKMIYTFALGTQRLYDFIENNPVCDIRPADYTNDPFIIAQNDKAVAINNCLAVDLYGQISSDTVGPRQISGTGGSMDFMLGAFRSNGGKGFMCLNSITQKKDGTLESNIVPSFAPYTCITVPRTIVHFVATEYGLVCLKGKSTWERAEALVSIAHPDFRDDLIKMATKNRIWVRSNKIPA